MNVTYVLTVILLGIGVGAALLSSIGILMMRDFYERLHYIGPVGSVGAIAFAGALVLKESFSPSGIKVILVAFLLVVSNSVLTHAMARAGRIHRLGDWKPRGSEDMAEEEMMPKHSSGRAHKKRSRGSRRK